MITKFDRNTAKDLQIDVIDELQSLIVEKGLKVKPGSGSFGPTSFTMKLIFEVGDEKILNVEAEEKWKRVCGYYGFDASDFGRTFVMKSSRYQISGIEPGRRKYPIIGKNVVTGKEMLFTVNIKNILE